MCDRPAGGERGERRFHVESMTTVINNETKTSTRLASCHVIDSGVDDVVYSHGRRKMAMLLLLMLLSTVMMMMMMFVRLD